jgi:hypothetical protein
MATPFVVSQRRQLSVINADYMTNIKGAIAWMNGGAEKKAKKTCASAQVGAKELYLTT